MIDDLDFRAILGVFRRRYLTIFGCVLLGLLLAGLGIVAIKPVYSASALVMVDPSRKNLLDPAAQASAGQSDSARVDGEVELVKADTTILEVVRKLGLVSDPEFGARIGLRDRIWAMVGLGETTLPTGEEALNAVVRSVQEAVTAQRRGSTFLIAVSARSTRPQFAAQLANAVAETYITEQLRSKIAGIEASRDIIDARMGDAGAALARAEQAFDQFIEENLQAISQEIGRTDLLALRDEIDGALRQRSTAMEAAGRVEQALARHDWAAIADELQTEVVRELERQRSALASRIDAGDGASLKLRDELAKLESDISQAASSRLELEKKSSAEAQDRASALRTELRSQLLSARLPPGILASLYQLQQAAEISRQQYQTLASRQADLETQAFLQVADSRIASAATPPSEPSFPNARLFLLAGLIGGLVVGAGLALVVENFIGGFADPDQLEDVLRVPTLGTVPWQKPAGSDEPSAAEFMVNAPLSAFAESVRRVRVGMDRILRDRDGGGGKVIAVTSANPGEGKSSMALALARSYAMNGRSTLLVDCDLRHPSLHRYLELQPSSGLLDYLSNEEGVPFESILLLDEGSGAHVVVGAKPSDRPTDSLVNGVRFQRLLEAARQSFDYIILDTPPAGPVVDAFVLGAMADVVLFVVKCASTPQSVVRATVKDLQAAIPDVPIRTVLNQKREVRHGYHAQYGEQYVT